ncbi:cytochrome b N-terminal domain-containing protein [Candidatus Marsarchaeota archaeon]|jgi:hypothetical protein|nr:cytochrome b N-terminal domain-containing protein [Candidatus Marsarchaeota archaeon]MCL5099911.1 cytochrome b N-terminal domain-containing protein [Candidatus Marsarchaeota archaeon]
MDVQRPPEDTGPDEDETKPSSIRADIKAFVQSFYITNVPSYGNNFFFTIGIYLLELFAILAISGMIMLIFGPYWWDLSVAGTFVRSVHLWAAEAFVTLMFVHLFVQLTTSAYRKKRLVWMLGAVMLLLVLLEFAFGVGIAGGLISQWNAKAGADLWNGMGLGYWLNPLNMGAVLGWHVAIVPILLAILMFTHYMLVKSRGLNTPYRKDIPYSIVAADHRTMYKRMGYIAVIVLLFAIFLRVPYTAPLTIAGIANAHPDAVALTLLEEFNFSSNTATYIDTIDPYTFSTRNVYVTAPYTYYLNITSAPNAEEALLAENVSAQRASLAQAHSYFDANGSIAQGRNSSDPMIALASELTLMAQEGLYQPAVQNEEASGLDTTYVLLFINDTGELGAAGQEYGLTTGQWGMLKVAAGSLPIQYWLAPYNLLEIMTSGIPWWNDIENGTLAFLAFLVLLLLPYIPGLRSVPDKLKLYKIFWNRFTVPELKKRKK